MLYFRRTMVMSEEEEEERRRDAAISTNCDMLPPSLSLPFSSPTGLVACWRWLREFCPSFLHFLFERIKPDVKGKFWQNLKEFYCCD